MPDTVELGTLKTGDCFIMPWRPAGRNIGTVRHVGVGSVDVTEPGTDQSSSGGWAHGTQVIPTERQALIEQNAFRSETRERSSVESPVQLVHRICNEMKGKPRDEIIARCIELGVNKSTAKTQFYAWRKKN